MEDKRCIACKARLPVQPLLTLDAMPASAQDLPDESGLQADKGITLRLNRCAACGLVQFDCPPVSYYQDVIRSGGFTSTMVELRRRQYRRLIEKYGLQGKRFLEAGCGQGEFLSVLSEFPVTPYGIEHKADLVQMAVKRGLTVWRQFAADESIRLSDASLGVTGPFDAFLSFNFLEHQPEPVRMLRCLYRNMVPEGMGLITVPSLEYILKYDGYYELIRDHLAYYTFDTLRFVLELAGFEVLEEEVVNRDTLSVIVRKRALDSEGTGRDPGALGAVFAGFESASATSRPADDPAIASGIAGFVRSRQDLNREIDRIVKEFRENGRTLAIWGASHQGFTVAATTGLKDFAKYIIDSAPFKQGRYAPASHLPIVAPDHFKEDPADAILIVAPGYTEEIAKNIRERLGSGVTVMTLRSRQIELL